MNSSETTQPLPPPIQNSVGSLHLVIKGLQNVPSFKNRKRAIQDHKTGKLRTLTEPKIKKRMQALEDAIASELLSQFQTTGNGTGTACSLRSWIAYSLPEKDCWQCVPSETIEVKLGPESAIEIHIEEIN